MNFIKKIIKFLFKINYPRCFCCNRKMDERYGGSFASTLKCQFECNYFIFVSDEQYSAYTIYDISSLKVLMRMDSNNKLVLSGDARKHIPYPYSEKNFEKTLLKYKKLNNFK